MTAHVGENGVRRMARCLGCECTDDDACDTGWGPCGWLAVDYDAGIGVCSECPEALVNFRRIEGTRAPMAMPRQASGGGV